MVITEGKSFLVFLNVQTSTSIISFVNKFKQEKKSRAVLASFSSPLFSVMTTFHLTYFANLSHSYTLLHYMM